MQPRLAIDLGWRALIGAAFRPARPDAGAQVRAMAEREGGHAVVGLSVRTLFDALLAALPLERGDGVSMSAVNVEDMATIVTAHGLRLTPVDVALTDLVPSTEAASAAVAQRARVLVIAQLYGARGDLRPLGALCRREGVLLVEDAAQAYDGRLFLPEGVDVSLYSFGPIKSATSLGGAIALFRNAALADEVRRKVDTYPATEKAWYQRRLLRAAMLKALNAPPSYAVVVGALRLLGRDPDQAIGRAARGFRSGELLPQLRRRPPLRLLTLLARRLGEGWTSQARVSRAEQLLEEIGSVLQAPGAELASHARWLTPVLASEPDSLIAHLRAEGFDATRGATSMRALAGPQGAPPAQAAQLIDQVVYLPTTPYMTPSQITRLARSVRAYTGERSRRRGLATR